MKLQWIIWTVLALVVVVGNALYKMSTAVTRADLTLTPNASVEVSVFQLRPHSVSHRFFGLRFRLSGGKRRPELGDFNLRRGLPQADFLDFSDPGELVKIRISLLESGREYVFEARPAGSYDGTTMGRHLVPFIEDGDPHRFSKGPERELWPTLPIGTSHYDSPSLKSEN